MQSFIVNSHEVFIHIHQGCFAGTGAIVRLPQCQWSKPDEYGKISQCITTTKHSKAKTVCIFLGIYCIGVYVNYMLACGQQKATWSNCTLHLMSVVLISMICTLAHLGLNKISTILEMTLHILIMKTFKVQFQLMSPCCNRTALYHIYSWMIVWLLKN